MNPQNFEEEPQPSTSKRKRFNEDENIVIEELVDCKMEPVVTNADEYYDIKVKDSDRSSKLTQRKRKFVFPGDNFLALKRKRKFYYIGGSMLKSRKTRIQKRAVIAQPIQYIDSSFGDLELNRHPHEKRYFTKTDDGGNTLLVNRSHMESDLFCVDEKRHSYELSKCKDLSFHVVDEISLEGLDGITLEAFWKRLEAVFPNNFSKKVRDSIWKSICANKQIGFYILNKSRDHLIPFDRWKYVDLDSGTIIDPIGDFRDIYSYKLVNQGLIRGSCSMYDLRKENNTVRKLSYYRANLTYGQKLVLVASQTLRNKALIHDEADPLEEFSAIEFCILERVGRSREYGELTHGEISLQKIHSDPKKLFYNRKVLSQAGLIINQGFFLKSLASQQNVNGGLVHLTRFYNKRLSKHVLIMDQLAQILRKRPDYSIDFTEFRRIFGRSQTMIKLIKLPVFRKYFKIYAFLYREIYPDAPKSEWSVKSAQKERNVRIIKLTDPYINITAVCNKSDTPTLPKVIDGTPGKKLMNYEYLRDVFFYIISSGKDGVTVQEIHDYFKTDFYTIRMVIKKLIDKKVVVNRKIDQGRQQCLKFYALALTNPKIDIKLVSKEYKLDPLVVLNVLKGYDRKLDESIEMYSDYEGNKATVQVENNEVSPHFTLTFDTFLCNAYLTDSTDSMSGNMTICDIINKGRDRLLLCASNLSVLYLPEWENFVLKRPEFFKNVELFRSGFGKIVYDFLSSLKVTLTSDNCIVFDLNYLITTGVRRCSLIPSYEHHISIERNYVNPYSHRFVFDFETKLCLFQALFDDHHDTHRVIENLRQIVRCSPNYDGPVTPKRQKLDQAQIRQKWEELIQFEDSNVAMDKFLGPHPILEFSDRDTSGITTEIFVSTQPNKIVQSGTLYTTNDRQITDRFINRANMIITHLHELKIVKDPYELMKMIRSREDRSGHDKIMCNKTGLSILSHLVEEGFIKIIQVVLRRDSLTRSHVFVCEPDQSLDHSFIQSMIDELKMKLYVGSPGLNKFKSLKVQIKAHNKKSPFNASDVKNSISELQAMTKGVLPATHKRSKEIGRRYGFCPKFLRMRVLHEFLHYLIYDLSGKTCGPLALGEVADLFYESKLSLTCDLEAIPPIYCKEISWKTFVPTLPEHENWPKGWALACDIILKLPLSIFVQIYNVTYYVKELEEFLKDPLKKHYLIKYLPDNIRTVLLYNRKYFLQIYEVFANLCYVGLLQLGPRSCKQKDQIFIYLNKRASLYDTTTSSPGYHIIEDKPYVKKSYEFLSKRDIDLYWSELWRICHNTPLGKRKVMEGEVVVIHNPAMKPELMQTLKAKTPRGAVDCDNGELPGDLKGAAGLDSSLWSFMKRNWFWGRKSIPKKIATAVNDFRVKPSVGSILYGELLQRKGTHDKRVYLTEPKQSKGNGKKSKKIKPVARAQGVRRSVIYRKIRPRERVHRLYHDNVDRGIMKRNRHARIEWDESEDRILRFSRVASLFLCPKNTKQLVYYNIIRDVLHRLNNRSKNKSSHACKRRVTNLTETDELMKVMESNTENLVNHPTIYKCFGHIHMQAKYDPEEIHVAFVYLVSYMMRNSKEIERLLLGYVATIDFFSKPYRHLFELILEPTDTKKTSAFTPVKTCDDISKDTIKSILHAILSQPHPNNREETFRLYHTYKQFPDELIKETVFELKSAHFLNLNRGYMHKTVNLWPLKFSPMYCNLKSSIFTHLMYSAAYLRLQSLINGEISHEGIGNFLAYNEIATYLKDFDLVFDIPEMEIILNPEIDDHSEVIDELAKRFLLYLEKIHQSSFHEVDIMEKRDTVKISESNNEDRTINEVQNLVMCLIFRVPYLIEGELEKHFKKIMESDNHLQVNNYIGLMVGALKEFALTSADNKELNMFLSKLTNQTDDQTELLTNLSKIVFSIQLIHQIGANALSWDSRCIDERYVEWERDELDAVSSSIITKFEQHHQSIIKNVEQKPSSNRLFSTRNSSINYWIDQARLGEFPAIDEIKEGMMSEDCLLESRHIPRITDLTMLLTKEKFPELDVDDDTIERWNEHFIIQHPQLHEFHIVDIKDFVNDPITADLISDDDVLLRIGKRMNECAIIDNADVLKIQDYLANTENYSTNLEFVNTLITYISEKKEFGASGSEIKTKFSTQTSLDLKQLLEYLCSNYILLRAGTTSIRFVHHDFQSHWLIHSFKLPPDDEDISLMIENDDVDRIRSNIEKRISSTDIVKIQLKPWIKLDGTFNEELCMNWLCVVLSKCCDSPSITFSQLSKHFWNFKPVDLFSMLEILQQFNCVEVFHYTKPEITLLSARSVITDIAPATILDDFEGMFIKTTAHCALSFGHVSIPSWA